MPGWMPILCSDYFIKFPRQGINYRDDLVAFRNGQRPAGTKIILYICNDQTIIYLNHSLTSFINV